MASLLAVSSISRVLRARFGKKDDEDDCDKKDEDGEKKTKHSIDGILGDKGKSPLYFSLTLYVYKLGLNGRFVAWGLAALSSAPSRLCGCFNYL